MSVWLAIGGAVVDGVLTETSGLARQPASAIVSGVLMTLAEAVTFGPFTTAAGPFAAFGLFNAATAGTMTVQGSLGPLTVPAGAYLTFPPGSYVVSAAGAPGADVLTLGGIPLTVAGQPLQAP